MIGTLQLWNLYGLLNGLVHGNLSLRHNRDISDLVGELREWNLDGLGPPVDLLLDDELLFLQLSA